jgi:hypothetical protein
MSLEGALKDFSIREVLQLFAIGKKTGLVKFKHNDFYGLIAFRLGEVYYAESTSESGSISERLVKEKKISAKALRQAQGLLKINKENKTLIEILTSGNFIDKSSLELAIKNIIIDAIFDIGLHTEAQFVFSQNEEHKDEFAVVSLEYDEIVKELVRREKTWEAIKKKIPDFEQVYQLAPDAADRAAEIRLKPIEWRIICLLNGENNLVDIARELGLSYYKLGKTIYGLLSAGLIKEGVERSYVTEEYFADI